MSLIWWCGYDHAVLKAKSKSESLVSDLGGETWRFGLKALMKSNATFKQFSKRSMPSRSEASV